MRLLSDVTCNFPHLSWWAQYLHPGQLRTPCGGYWFWSGLGSDLGEVTILAAMITVFRHRNCHVKGCLRLGHTDPEHGFPACRHHHSQGGKVGRTAR